MKVAIRWAGIAALCSAASMFHASAAFAEQGLKDPVELLYQFQAKGDFVSFDSTTGKTTYRINAQGIAPRVRENGLIHPGGQDDDGDTYKVQLTGADITFDPFDPTNPPPIMKFSCAGCQLKFPDGSTLTSDPSVPLEGRALFLYGPVAPDPNSPIMTVRMAGCSGLRETSGTGRLANKVGSICFNGVFNFDLSNPNSLPASITGASNCTIVMHTPPAH